MKKIIILLLLAFFLIPIALASDSEDRTEYYNDGTYYITDNIESSGELGLDGDTVTNGLELSTTGWASNGAGGTPEYSNAQAFKGTFSIHANNPTGNSADDEGILYNIADNASFTGKIEVTVRPTDSGAGGGIIGFQFTPTSSSRQDIYYRPSVSTTNWVCNSAACSTPVAIDKGNWQKLTLNFTGSNVEFWVESTLSHTFSVTGIADIRIIAHEGGAGTAEAYFDDFAMYNEDRPQQAVVPAANPNITFNAQDFYDSSTIENFSVFISGQGNAFNLSTSNGTITVENLTENILYNVTFVSNQTAQYFNTTYLINFSQQTFTANLSQSWINLYVNDSLTGGPLGSFTVVTNFSTHTGTDGYILLPSKEGSNHELNISTNAYPQQTFTYSINALENISFTANMSPIFSFFLRREADNSVFDIDGANSTKLTIYCPEKNIVINFKNDSYQSTEENATVDCPYTLMKMDVTYTDSSYFRTLIPETDQTNVTWWLLDLNVDTGVQKILELVDLTGEWASGLLRIKTAIDQNNEDIIEQHFDVATATTLYLLKDALYTVSLVNEAGDQERQLGSLIPDSAGTITITYPNIPFYPEESILESNISWSYDCNATQSIFRLNYEDGTSSTNYIEWNVYNGTNSSHLLQFFSSSTANTSYTFTYTNVEENRSYYAQLHAENTQLDFNISDSKTCGSQVSVPDFTGWTQEEEEDIKLYVAAIFLVLLGLLFSAKHAGIGMSLVFVVALMFKIWGWFPIHTMWLALMGFSALSGFVYEGLRKD